MYRKSLAVRTVSHSASSHRLMLGSYVAHICGAPENEVLDLPALCARAGLPPVAYSHDGANFNNGLPPFDPFVAASDVFSDRRTLFLTRDPRDILVSAYMHARYREHCYHRDLASFIRDPTTGLPKILAAYSRWYDNRNRASSFAVLAYEDMWSDPAAALRSALLFLGAEPDEPAVARAVQFGSFANMRTIEETGLLPGSPMKSRYARSETSRKVRRGIVGEHRERFSADDLLFVEEGMSNADGFLAPYRNLSNPVTVKLATR